MKSIINFMLLFILVFAGIDMVSASEELTIDRILFVNDRPYGGRQGERFHQTRIDIGNFGLAQLLAGGADVENVVCVGEGDESLHPCSLP